MSTEKKIRFTAEDGLSSTFDRMRQKSNQYFSEWQKQSQEQNKSAKEQIAFISEQIKAMERLNRLQKDEAIVGSRDLLNERLSKAKTPSQIEKAHGKYRAEKSEISSSYNEEKATISILKDLLIEEKKLKEEENEQRKRDLDLAEEQYSNKKSLWDQEIKEDRKRVKEKIDAAKAGFFGRMMGKNDFDNLPDHEKEKRMYQQTVLANEQTQKKESIFGAIMKAEAVKQLINATKDAALSIPHAQDENALAGKLFGAIPRATGALFQTAGMTALGDLIGGIMQSAEERHLSALKERDEAQVGLKGVTGRNTFAALNLGYTSAQIAEIAKQVALSGGSSLGLRNRTLGLLGLESGYGLDRGSLLEAETMGKFSGRSGVRQVSELIASLKSGGALRNGDNTQLGMFLQIQNTLLQEQAKIFARPDSSIATGIIAAFRNLGGGFGDSRMQEGLMKIHGQLTSPGNDFQKARSFGVLAGMNPSADYFDLLGMQEKGIFQEGALFNTLNQLKGEYGTGKAFRLATKTNFGFTNDQTNALIDQFLANPNLFKSFSGSEKDFMRQFGGDSGAVSSAISKGEVIIPEVKKSAARIQEAFVSSFEEGLFESLKETGDKAGKELSDLIVRTFKRLGISNPFNSK